MNEAIQDMYRAMLIPRIEMDKGDKDKFIRVYGTFNQQDEMIYLEDIYKPYHFRINYDEGTIMKVRLQDVWK